MKTGARLVALALAAPMVALACGVCVEDRIAATYDHAVVERAARGGPVMVRCALDGAIDARRIERLARRTRGVEAASVRVSTQPGALAFALDARAQRPEAAVASLQRAFPRVRITLLPTPAP